MHNSMIWQKVFTANNEIKQTDLTHVIILKWPALSNHQKEPRHQIQVTSSPQNWEIDTNQEVDRLPSI